MSEQTIYLIFRSDSVPPYVCEAHFDKNTAQDRLVEISNQNVGYDFWLGKTKLLDRAENV